MFHTPSIYWRARPIVRLSWSHCLPTRSGNLKINSLYPCIHFYIEILRYIFAITEYENNVNYIIHHLRCISRLWPLPPAPPSPTGSGKRRIRQPSRRGRGWSWRSRTGANSRGIRYWINICIKKERNPHISGNVKYENWALHTVGTIKRDSVPTQWVALVIFFTFTKWIECTNTDFMLDQDVLSLFSPDFPLSVDIFWLCSSWKDKSRLSRKI